MQYADRVYGAQEIDDRLIIELINTREMQRLKGIDQYGVYDSANQRETTTRFEHSLGVYFLLRHFDAPHLEQVAGLLHDVSHTAFSHAIDWVYDKHSSQEMHEEFYSSYTKAAEFTKILLRNNINPELLSSKNKFRILERNLPDLCADRLDYLFRDTLVLGFASHEKIQALLNSLKLHDGEIIVGGLDSAAEIANLFLKISTEFYTSPKAAAAVQVLANAMKIALNAGIITPNDFYLTDAEVFDKLRNSKNKEILSWLSVLDDTGRINLGTEKDYTFYTKGKVRFIDPKFFAAGALKRLSDVDSEFKRRAEEFKRRVEKGFYIKILK